MRYLLDFDGVIFNTKALKEKMSQLGLPQTERSANTFSLMHSLDPEFDAQALVYPDALAFLQENKTHISVVSSYMSIDPGKNVDEAAQRSYQSSKIERSGVTALIGQKNVHVVGSSKAEALEILKKQYQDQAEECVFVDDHLQYVHEAKVLGIRTFWMVREPQERQESMIAIADVQRIASFDELRMYTHE